MKVIDLLNKIANGEEVPKKIKLGDFVLEWEERGYHDYKFLGSGNHLLFQGFATSLLSDEIEIMEEDKKIERIGEITFRNSTDNIKEEVLLYKINEIIDYINKEDK